MDAALADETVASLHDPQPAFDWVGVYLVEGPILRDGRVVGVLDVDSNTLDAFGDTEVAAVERAAGEIAARA